MKILCQYKYHYKYNQPLLCSDISGKIIRGTLGCSHLRPVLVRLTSPALFLAREKFLPCFDPE